jgi:hypothetical protein
MNHSKSRTGRTRRNIAIPGTGSRLIRGGAGRAAHARRDARPDYRHDPDEGHDDMAELLGDIEHILERQTKRNTQDTGIRRRIEVLREERRLQQELSDLYDS